MKLARKLGFVGLLVAIALATGCQVRRQAWAGAQALAELRLIPHRMEAGTTLMAQISQTLSSRTAHVGMAWSGIVARDVRRDSKVVVPAGSAVHGVVTRVESPGGSPALQLAIGSVIVEGRRTVLDARSEPWTGPLTRSRPGTGPIVDAVPCASLGRAAVSTGNGEPTALVLRAGTPMSFTVLDAVAVR